MCRRKTFGCVIREKWVAITEEKEKEKLSLFHTERFVQLNDIINKKLHNFIFWVFFFV
jgi:hypothetical protein